jgi:hypothetical protein
LFEHRVLRRIFGPKGDVVGEMENTTEGRALWFVFVTKYYSADQIKNK